MACFRRFVFSISLLVVFLALAFAAVNNEESMKNFHKSWNDLNSRIKKAENMPAAISSSSSSSTHDSLLSSHVSVGVAAVVDNDSNEFPNNSNVVTSPASSNVVTPVLVIFLICSILFVSTFVAVSL